MSDHTDSDDDVPVHELVLPTGERLARVQVLHPSLTVEQVGDALALYGIWTGVDRFLATLRRDDNLSADFVEGAHWLRDQLVAHLGHDDVEAADEA